MGVMDWPFGRQECKWRHNCTHQIKQQPRPRKKGAKGPADEGSRRNGIKPENNCGKGAETISMDACNKALQIAPFCCVWVPFSAFLSFLFIVFSLRFFPPVNFPSFLDQAPSIPLLFWLFAQRILSQLQEAPRPSHTALPICIFNFIILGRSQSPIQNPKGNRESWAAWRKKR